MKTIAFTGILAAMALTLAGCPPQGTSGIEIRVVNNGDVTWTHVVHDGDLFVGSPLAEPIPPSSIRTIRVPDSLAGSNTLGLRSEATNLIVNASSPNLQIGVGAADVFVVSVVPNTPTEIFWWKISN